MSLRISLFRELSKVGLDCLVINDPDIGQDPFVSRIGAAELLKQPGKTRSDCEGHLRWRTVDQRVVDRNQASEELPHALFGNGRGWDAFTPISRKAAIRYFDKSCPSESVPSQHSAKRLSAARPSGNMH